MHKPKRRKGDAEPMEVDESIGANGDVERENGNNNGINGETEIDHISDDDEGGVRIGDIYIPPAPKPALTFDSNGPRMVISHIVNENFKSYAGKEVLGPFHKSFTAIIGPNGSGKSNVIDSMLFVFGYRASKIRSKKISVLIHSSSKFPNVTSASVTVQFCEIIDGDGDNFTVVPGSEIEVTRAAFKDNSSYYSLNGRRVQFKEVAKLLRGQGIDLDHNRFLILQGEVEQIAMMKPKGQNENDTGMLEYLEDIIGTARYKEPIEKLFVRVEEYSVLRKEKLNRVRFVEQEKLKLEQPMKEAIEMMNLTNSFIRTRNLLLQKYLFETEKILATKQANLEKEKQKVAEIEEKLKKIQDELHEKNAVLKKGSQKYIKLQTKKEELTEKLQSLKKKSVTVQADITQGNKKKKNLEQLLEQEKGKLIDLETIPEKNKREIEDCEKLLEKNNELKEKAEEELQKVVAGVRSKTQGLQEQKDKFQAKMIELNKIVDEANKNFKLAESEMKIYVSTEKKEMEKLEKMKVDYEKAVAELEEKRTVYDELSETYPENERKVYEMNKKLHQIKTEETSVANTARNLRSQLEESRQAMSANKSRGRVLDSLMKEKQNGNIPGIFGRLGDLGGIDPKYDVAISTCCGALDNIVVDCVETAQACLEFLRANDIGRATFIALDKQQHFTSQMNRQQDFPENVPRLFDLIRVKDSRVLAAFYYGVRDTLVATDLDQASRIAYGRTRYRVVSLKGDVIEIAGTMSGGGRTMMRGRMSSSVQQDTSEQDPRAVRHWEEQLEREETRLNELRREQSAIEDSLQTLEKTTQEQKMMLNKVKIQLKSLEEQIPILQNQIKAQERKAASSKVDERQRKVLEKKMNDANAILEQARHNAGEVEKEVHGVDAQIAAIAGNKVKSMQNNVNELSAKISKITTEITKLRVAINTSIRNAKKSKDKIAQMEIDQSETLKNLENWNIQKKKLTLDSGEIQREIEQCDEKINEGGEEFSDLKKEIKKLQDEETKCKSERLEANNSLTLMEKSVTECAAKLPQWERELKQLKLEDPGIEGMENLSRPEPLQKHTPEELEGMTVEEIRNKLNGQKARIGDNKPNLQAILDYKTKEEVFLKRAAELEEITAQRNEMRALHDQLKKRRLTDFLSGFNTITGKLKEMYQMITLGGDAELEMVDSLDPFSEGITFIVRPPSKSWKYISNLSGGEKTLSSLALVFALHYYRPTPLYVMDEIDAALDFKNVSIVANYIKERTKNAQFIIISLRYNMFEVSNRLVGIYKTEDCTKSVTVNNALPIDFVIDGDIMD